MYVYQVGYFSWEGSPQRYVVHDFKFDSEEFEQIVLSAVEGVLRKWVETPFNSTTLDTSVPWADVRRFESFVPDTIVEWLVSERGFRLLEVTSSVAFDGWARVLPDQDDGFPLSKHDLNKAVTTRLIETGLADAITKKNEEYDKYLRQLSDDDGG